MSILGTIVDKLRAIVHAVATGVHDIVEDVKERIEEHHDIPPEKVAARLDEMAASDPQKLKWRTSIVDLLKLLGMDSSLSARKALAGEINPDYGREFEGEPEQNIWLHAQVMTAIAKHGIRLI